MDELQKIPGKNATTNFSVDNYVEQTIKYTKETICYEKNCKP